VEKDGRKGRRSVALVAAALIALPAVARGQDALANVRLTNVVERGAVARALEGAFRQIEHAECQAVLDEFADRSGRSLRAALQESGMSAPDYLRHVFFYDGTPQLCSNSVLARTIPGSRAILVCGPHFVQQMSQDSRHAEAALIHEMLHSLGLGENPPAGHVITERVRAHCGQS
jgi:hypothetical protein